MQFLRPAFIALMLGAWTIAAGPAQAQGLAYSDAELLAALENSYWIAMSAPRPKQVYVLAAPWCPICRRLHQTLTEQPSDVEYRFVLTAPRSQSDRVMIGHAAFSRSAAALDDVYGRGADIQRSATPAETFADGLNDALWTALNASLQARSDRPIGLPLLVFLSSGRLRVLAGMPPDFAALSAAADAGAPGSQPPRLSSLLEAPPQLTPIAPKIAYARRDGTVLYALPNSAATKLNQVKTGVGFMAAAVTEQGGERWYAFQFVANGPPASFGKAKDFR